MKIQTTQKMTALFATILAASLLAPPARGAAAQTSTDEMQAARAEIKSERKVAVAGAMQFTEAEGKAFWPFYGEYRAAMDQLGDRYLKLIVEYADAYPNVPEERAEKLLKDYLALEKDLVSVRAKHLEKLTTILPKSKVLRFAQVDSRLDTVLRLQLASSVPLLPTEGRISGEVSGAAAAVEGVAGGAFVQTHQLTATVIAINQASRKVTLLSPDGIKQTVKVGPGAINFSQIQVGDTLKVEVTQELVVQLASPGEATDDGSAALVALAPKGAKPGGVIAETTQVIATVTAIDQPKHTATLRFEDGSTKTFPVRSDVDLGKRKVGEKVVFRATEMVALRVEKP